MELPVLAATTPFWVLAILALVLRLYTRAIMTKVIYAEEYFLMASALFATSWWVTKVIIHDDANYSHTLFMIVGWWSAAAWGASSALTKLAIIWQYRRIFPIRWMRITCDIFIVVLVLYGLYAFFGGVFLCVPVPYIWGGVSEGSCMNRHVFFYLVAAVNMAADVIMYALPVQPVLALRISKQQKMELLLLFSSGAFVIVASIMRLYWCVVYMRDFTNTYAGEMDMIWCGIEVNATLFCACLPALRPLFRPVFPRIKTLFSSTAGRRRSAYNNTYDRYPDSAERQGNQKHRHSRYHPKTLYGSATSASGGGGASVPERAQYKMQRLQSDDSFFRHGTGNHVIITGQGPPPQPMWGSGSLPDGPQHLVQVDVQVDNQQTQQQQQLQHHQQQQQQQQWETGDVGQAV